MKSLFIRVQILCAACLILSAPQMGPRIGAAYGQTETSQRPQPGPKPGSKSVGSGGSHGGGRTEPSGPPVIMYGDDDYKLASRDVIEVIVEDAPELSVNYTINSKGVIPFRFLGALAVAGKTVEEVTKIITDGLRGRYLQDPQVYVSVKQYNSRTFFIQGAVRNPGVYVISGKPSLFRLMTIAGGLRENHGLVAYIFRETAPKAEKLETGASQNSADSQLNQIVKDAKGEANAQTQGETQQEAADGRAKGTATDTEGEPDYEMITANLGGVLRGRLDNNIIIQPGDLVYIPPADVFYVAGEVKAPGQFPLTQGITLRHAISLAGGTHFKARLGKGIIFRTDPITGNLTELPVDIGDVMGGKSQDMTIQGNDVVWIPSSTAKSIGSTVLNAFIPAAMFRIPFPR